MAKYVHDCQGQHFEIEVDGLTLSESGPPECFIARIKRVSDGEPKTVAEKGTSRRTFYGHTEPWALKNAQDLLDHGNWTVEEEPVRRVMTHSEASLA
jgi:hypothetical protein